MTADKLRELHKATRSPDKNRIGKLPRGNVHLDYLGHADVTDILLEHDPLWNWEPPTGEELALLGAPDGAVICDASGRPHGLWIALVIHGHRRLGYGSCRPGEDDAVKKLIGDALRNAAMRFGVAVSLWSKSEAWEEGPAGNPAPRQEGSGPPDGVQTADPTPIRKNVPQAAVDRHPSALPATARLAIAAEKAGYGPGDDEARRDVLQALTGKRSSKGLDPAAVRKALDGFRGIERGELELGYDADGKPFLKAAKR